MLDLSFQTRDWTCIPYLTPDHPGSLNQQLLNEWNKHFSPGPSQKTSKNTQYFFFLFAIICVRLVWVTWLLWVAFAVIMRFPIKIWTWESSFWFLASTLMWAEAWQFKDEEVWNSPASPGAATELLTFSRPGAWLACQAKGVWRSLSNLLNVQAPGHGYNARFKAWPT